MVTVATSAKQFEFSLEEVVQNFCFEGRLQSIFWGRDRGLVRVLPDCGPRIEDIDAAFDETVLSDDEATALEAQRMAGTARPTVQLVRYARSE